MDFLEYQKKTHTTFLDTEDSPKLILARMALGLVDESGEVAGKVKKYLRRDFSTDKLKEKLVYELGDVLWYLSEICNHLDLDLDTIATLNLSKLADRQKRDVIKGSGDNR